jgi:hypothetical protein
VRGDDLIAGGRESSRELTTDLLVVVDHEHSNAPR